MGRNLRVAAVDIGTNTTRLLIAEFEGGQIRDIERIATVTALGRSVDQTGRLAEDAIARTLPVLAKYGEVIVAAGVVNCRAVATSASRDAANRQEFFDLAQNELSFRPELISGTEEASLSFAGATANVERPAETVVIDCGGGSTEFVTSHGGVSVDIGSVRLTERCLPNHPASLVELDAARTEAARVIAIRDLPDRSTALGVAGTWTSLAAINLDLGTYDAVAIEGTVILLDHVRRLVNWLAGLTLDGKQAIPSLDPKRAPVILGGAIVAEASLQALALDRVTVTEHDILDGICFELADQ